MSGLSIVTTCRFGHRDKLYWIWS